jgi:hypothetical protein
MLKLKAPTIAIATVAIDGGTITITGVKEGSTSLMVTVRWCWSTVKLA